MWLFSKSQESLGKRGERWAQDEYRQRGYKILGQNFFNRKGKQFGEIDFIARCGDKICFVEVKTRASQESSFGSGLEAVNIYKQQKLLKAVKLFLQQNPKYLLLKPAIDVCVIEWTELDKKPKSATILSNAVEDIF